MAEQGGQEAKIALGFDYDPKEIESFLKAMQKTKSELQDTAGTLDKFKEGFSGFGGIVKGAIGAVSGLITAAQIREADSLPKRFADVFKGVEKEAQKAALNLRKHFGESLDSAQLKLIDIQETLNTLGVRGARGLGISEKIIQRAVDVANETGRNYESVLSAFQGFVTSGGKDITEFAKIFRKNKRIQEQLQKYSEETVITGTPDSAAVLRAASTLFGASKGFAGSAARDPGVAFLQRQVKSDVAEGFNKAATNLTGGFKELLKTVRIVTKHFEKLGPILAGLVAAGAVGAAGKGLLYGLKKGGIKLPKKLLGAGRLGVYGIIAYLLGKFGDQQLEEGFGEEFGEKYKGLKGGIKGKAKGLFDRAKGGIQDLIGINDIAVRRRHGLSPSGGGASITNNNSITINARTNDPKKMAEEMEPEIERIAEKNFRQLNEREIPQHTSAEK